MLNVRDSGFKFLDERKKNQDNDYYSFSIQKKNDFLFDVVCRENEIPSLVWTYIHILSLNLINFSTNSFDNNQILNIPPFP